MASGDTLVVFTALHNEPPSSIAATIDLRNQHPVLDFDAAADEEAVFSAVMPRSYGGGGITVTLVWMASTATSGNAVWQTALERHQDETDDLDSDSFAAFQTSGAVAAPGTSGFPQYSTTTHTDGGQMDSVAVGESFRFKVRRDADDTSATDNMTGDAELLRVEIRET